MSQSNNPPTSSCSNADFRRSDHVPTESSQPQQTALFRATGSSPENQTPRKRPATLPTLELRDESGLDIECPIGFGTTGLTPGMSTLSAGNIQEFLPLPKTPKLSPGAGPMTPSSVTKKDLLGLIYGDPILCLPQDKTPTKIELVQLYMHLFDKVSSGVFKSFRQLVHFAFFPRTFFFLKSFS